MTKLVKTDSEIATAGSLVAAIDDALSMRTCGYEVLKPNGRCQLAPGHDGMHEITVNKTLIMESPRSVEPPDAYILPSSAETGSSVTLSPLREAIVTGADKPHTLAAGDTATFTYDGARWFLDEKTSLAARNKIPPAPEGDFLSADQLRAFAEARTVSQTVPVMVFKGEREVVAEGVDVWGWNMQPAEAVDYADVETRTVAATVVESQFMPNDLDMTSEILSQWFVAKSKGKLDPVASLTVDEIEAAALVAKRNSVPAGTEIRVDPCACIWALQTPAYGDFILHLCPVHR